MLQRHNDSKTIIERRFDKIHEGTCSDGLLCISGNQSCSDVSECQIKEIV